MTKNQDGFSSIPNHSASNLTFKTPKKKRGEQISEEIVELKNKISDLNLALSEVSDFSYSADKLKEERNKLERELIVLNNTRYTEVK